MLWFYPLDCRDICALSLHCLCHWNTIDKLLSYSLDHRAEYFKWLFRIWRKFQSYHKFFLVYQTFSKTISSATFHGGRIGNAIWVSRTGHPRRGTRSSALIFHMFTFWTILMRFSPDSSNRRYSLQVLRFPLIKDIGIENAIIWYFAKSLSKITSDSWSNRIALTSCAFRFISSTILQRLTDVFITNLKKK